jgi:hypothetical protein
VHHDDQYKQCIDTSTTTRNTHTWAMSGQDAVLTKHMCKLRCSALIKSAPNARSYRLSAVPAHKSRPIKLPAMRSAPRNRQDDASWTRLPEGTEPRLRALGTSGAWQTQQARSAEGTARRSAAEHPRAQPPDSLKELQAPLMLTRTIMMACRLRGSTRACRRQPKARDKSAPPHSAHLTPVYAPAHLCPAISKG